ncbi:MAG: DUF1330 domain-containing protein [Pseudomonadota bacterium]
MPKGYWIAHVDVHDEERYKDYLAANAGAFAKYGAEFAVRNGQSTQAEGSLPGNRHVVIAFPSYQAALDCYHSAEYAPAIAIRKDAANGNILIIEGYEGPQPGA